MTLVGMAELRGSSAAIRGETAPGGKPASGSAMVRTGCDPRLPPAAHAFEASLMKEFLEPLEHDALFSGGADDDSGEGSGGALMSFGSESLARAIADRGGFGIAAKIMDHFGSDGARTAEPAPEFSSNKNCNMAQEVVISRR